MRLLDFLIQLHVDFIRSCWGFLWFFYRLGQRSACWKPMSICCLISPLILDLNSVRYVSISDSQLNYLLTLLMHMILLLVAIILSSSTLSTYDTRLLNVILIIYWRGLSYLTEYPPNILLLILFAPVNLSLYNTYWKLMCSWVKFVNRKKANHFSD